MPRALAILREASYQKVISKVPKPKRLRKDIPIPTIIFFALMNAVIRIAIFCSFGFVSDPFIGLIGMIAFPEICWLIDLLLFMTSENKNIRRFGLSSGLVFLGFMLIIAIFPIIT